MRWLRGAFVALVGAVGVVPACAVPALDDELLRCPCADGFRCVDGYCTRRPDLGDGGEPDTGALEASVFDATLADADVAHDTGIEDDASALDGGAFDAGDDGVALVDGASFDAGDWDGAALDEAGPREPDGATMFDASREDAFAGTDAFLAPDAFVPRDAFAGPDAFLAPDGFVPRDAFVPPDTGASFRTYDGASCRGRLTYSVVGAPRVAAAGFATMPRTGTITSVRFRLPGSSSSAGCDSSERVRVYVWSQSAVPPDNSPGVSGVLVASAGDGVSEREVTVPLMLSVAAGRTVFVAVENEDAELCAGGCEGDRGGYYSLTTSPRGRFGWRASNTMAAELFYE